MSDMEFESLLGTGNHPPLVFQESINNWPAIQWTVAYLAKQLPDKQFQCKISPVDHEDVLMETECLHIQCTLQQYDDWLSGQPGENNPLSMFNPSKYSCYVDYKYMKDMFSDSPQVLQDVSWERFGFPGRDGTQSTIWIGSAGAYTSCHQDVYGFNLVAQIKGRKRWYLFPPTAGDLMYPTRVPFEESSVFSEVNVRNPDFRKHPKYQEAEPHIVILEPGEVLYVPRHWWHFVECLDSSISVNTWVEMEEDIRSRLQEAVTRFLFTSMNSLLPSSGLVSTYENLESVDANTQYIYQTIANIKESEEPHTLVKKPYVHVAESDVEHANSRTVSQPQPIKPGCSLFTKHANNHTQFSSAFKGHSVTIYENQTNKECSNASCQRGQKRYYSSMFSSDNKCCNCQVLKETQSSYSKIAKLEADVLCGKQSLDSSVGDGDSVSSDCDTGVVKDINQSVGCGTGSIKADRDDNETVTENAISRLNSIAPRTAKTPQSSIGDRDSVSSDCDTGVIKDINQSVGCGTGAIKADRDDNETVTEYDVSHSSSISLSMAKTPQSFGHPECNRYNDKTRIYTVPKLSYHEYIDYLTVEFEYDVNEYKNDSNEWSVYSKQGDAKLEPERSDNDIYALNVDIINSVLDQNVIRMICENLLQKLKG